MEAAACLAEGSSNSEGGPMPGDRPGIAEDGSRDYASA
jgi:hypothetical protein